MLPASLAGIFSGGDRSTRPHLGTCLMLGRAVNTRDPAHPGTACYIGSFSLFGIGIELALSLLSEAAANWWPNRTPQPTSTGDRQPRTRGKLRSCGPACPSHLLGSPEVL